MKPDAPSSHTHPLFVRFNAQLAEEARAEVRRQASIEIVRRKVRDLSIVTDKLDETSIGALRHHLRTISGALNNHLDAALGETR